MSSHATPGAIRRGLDPAGVDWTRVSPRYVGVTLVNTIIGSAIVGFAAFLPLILGAPIGVWVYVIPSVVLLVGLVDCLLTPRRVRAIGYQIRQDDFLFRRGIFFQRIVSVPYGRMQLVDINRGPVVRALGLAELKFVTAAAATGVTLPGLTMEDAVRLRDHLIAVAETRRSGL